MGEILLENGPGDTQDIEEKKTVDTPDNNFLRYVGLGGIINGKDFQSSLARAKQTTTVDKIFIAQAESMANTSGIVLHNSKDFLDPRIILYGILRSDIKPKEIKNHHSQMSDQHLFAEALRMLGDVGSLEKLIAAHPNISFNYKLEENQK